MTREDGGFRLVDRGPLSVVVCDALDAVAGIAHGFSTRRRSDGRDFDLGLATEEPGEFAGPVHELLEACGLQGRPARTLQQVHGARILILGDLTAGALERGDGIAALRADRQRGAPGVRYADCLPILLADRQGRAVAAVHAGWRGTAAGVAGRALEELTRLGIRPEDLLAALGPAIGPCCYQVGDEVLVAVARETGVDTAEVSRPFPGGTRALDLAEANRLQLIRGGVRPESVQRAPWCTSCEPGLFFSYRRQGSACGRMLACVGWRPAPPLP